jgi:rod shape determining protein RodA
VGRTFLLDWPIFVLGLILSGCGLVLIYSATWVENDPPGPHFSDIFIKQSIALIAALIAFHFLRRIKWGIKPDSWLWFYIPPLILLIVVLLIGHGMEESNSRRWINLGFFRLQPSEMSKVAWVMLVAWLFSEDPAKLRRNYLLGLFLLVSLVGLMMRQPDLGTSMVFVFAFFVMAMFTALPRKLILGTVLTMALLAIPAFFFLRTYQQNRVLELVGKQKWVVVDPETERHFDQRFEISLERARKMRPELDLELGSTFITDADATGVGYQANQGMIAVGSGGLTGKGFLRGTQAKGGFIPVVESDFIFALVGEEFGFFGSVTILILFFLLIARILALSRDAQTTYERFICYGASAVLLFHVFVAVGMTIRLMPVTGVPLPFLSQGGSSLLSFWILLAVLESIYEKSQGEYRRIRPATVVRRR